MIHNARCVPLLDIRESAFILALNAAGVAYAVTRACSMDDIKACACDPYAYREGMSPSSRTIAQKRIVERFKVSGVCQRNIDFGEKISRTVFTDKSADLDARTKLIRWNYEAGRKVGYDGGHELDLINYTAHVQISSRLLLSLFLQHFNTCGLFSAKRVWIFPSVSINLFLKIFVEKWSSMIVRRPLKWLLFLITRLVTLYHVLLFLSLKYCNK